MTIFAIKIHSGQDEKILAVCDQEVLGQTFRDGKKRITVSESFYNGEIVSEEILIERMKSATIMNFVGSKCISIAADQGYVDLGNVIDIGGVLHTQVVVK